MTLNVNGTGPKNLYQYGTTLMSSGTTTTGWPAGAVVPFVYDGTYWFRLYWNNTVTTVTTTGTGNAITAISASNGAITATKGTTFLTSHQDISGKADKSATVSTLTWDSTNKKITKTINGSTSDVVQFAPGGNIVLTGATGKLTIEAIDTKVTQNNTIADNDYRVLLSASANDTIETSGANKSVNLQYNPSTNLLKTGNISGSGDLTITGNTNLNGETYAESITAGSLLVNGNANFVQSPTAPTPEATSNDTTIATTAFVKNAFTENDAMVFKGTINANGDLPATHKQGWAYRVGTATSYAGKTCEVGDIIVCITDGTAANNDHWTVIQNNINGPIYREANSFTDKNIIIADGTAGKVKSSGVTITTATPAASSTSATIPTSNAVWSAITGASGYGKTGTVTGVQVQATSPVVSSTSGNATTSLNTTISLANAYGDTKNPYGTKTANYVLAGPSSGNAAAPTFRALVAADIPSLTKSKISDFPTSMPASDVSAWAKAASKPTYTASEVGAAAASHTHGNITNEGKITTTATIASGDKLVIVDSDSTAGSKITGSSITFDGSTTTKALTQKGTWETFLQSHQSLSAYAPLASPALTGTPTAPTPAATSNDTTIATTAFVMNAFTANDAMVFKGVVNANGDLPTTHKQGWTYRVATAGTYAGKVCEVGDMIICVTDGTAATDAHWAVIQNNVDGAVYRGTNAFTDANVIVADSTNGKVKSSGKTITATTPSSSAGDTTIPTSKAVWSAISSASGYGKTGTVTSVRVQATAPIVSSSNGTATTSLNTTISLAATSANYVIAGPSSGTTTAVPTYRKLVAADIPSLTKSKISDFPTNVSAFTNDSGYLTSFTETDPTVPSWAKASSKPSYTASEVGLGNVTNAAQITKATFTKAYQVMYSTAASTPAVLDANTTATKKFLRMTGTGSAGAAPAWDTVTKSDVGLGNVENTKLSTWAGSTAITTLGTISTGTVPWARLSNVPSSFTPASHTHGNLTNDGKISTTATIASGDKIVIVDSDSTAASKITGSSITFGTSTTTFLSNKGTWVTPPGTYSLPLATSGTRGGIRIGYSESGTNYAVKLSSEKAYVTVPWTDTKNTAGSTDTSSKIYLIGTTSQAANPQTYSDNQIYATNGQLDANKVRVAEAVSLVYDTTLQALNFVFA